MVAMKALEELRLGNWININGNPFQLELPDFNLIANKNGKSTYEPIELNEDWLLKFGFGRIGIEHLKLRFNDNVSEYVIYDTVRKDFLFFSNEQFWLCKVEFVHDFQNKLFALTGQELKIKES